MVIENVIVEADPTIFKEKELRKYVEYAQEKVKPATLTRIRVTMCEDEKVDIEWTTQDKFERIRRITGE